MSDFFVGIGLVLVIEGLLFAAFPSFAKHLAASALESPEGVMRISEVASALVGTVIVWLVRG